MNDTLLVRQEIDEAPLADLGPGLDQFGLRAHVLAAGEHPALPQAPGLHRLLVVVFRVIEAPPATAASATSWHLSTPEPADGRSAQMMRLPLLAEASRPLRSREERRAAPPPHVRGTVYRGAFCVDLGGLIQAGLLRPGQPLTIDYRQRDRAEVAMR